MSEVIIPNDPRDSYQKMTRREIWRALKNSNIPFPAGIKGPDGIKLLQANQIDPMTAIEWETVMVENEKKEQVPQQHPKRQIQHFSESDEMRRNAEMEKRLEDSAKKEESSKDEITELKALLAKQSENVANLTSMITDMKSGKITVDEVSRETTEIKSVKKITDLNKIHWKSFQKMAKGIGIEWTTRDPREPVIEKLESQQD